jgi:hypothetical protein
MAVTVISVRDKLSLYAKTFGRSALKMYVVDRFPTLNDRLNGLEGQIGNGSLSDIMGH